LCASSNSNARKYTPSLAAALATIRALTHCGAATAGQCMAGSTVKPKNKRASYCRTKFSTCTAAVHVM
jgi:hypothetical protein